jgi:hypothetical protein
MPPRALRESSQRLSQIADTSLSFLIRSYFGESRISINGRAGAQFRVQAQLQVLKRSR